RGSTPAAPQGNAAGTPQGQTSQETPQAGAAGAPQMTPQVLARLDRIEAALLTLVASVERLERRMAPHLDAARAPQPLPQTDAADMPQEMRHAPGAPHAPAAPAPLPHDTAAAPQENAAGRPQGL